MISQGMDTSCGLLSGSSTWGLGSFTNDLYGLWGRGTSKTILARPGKFMWTLCVDVGGLPLHQRLAAGCHPT